MIGRQRHLDVQRIPGAWNICGPSEGNQRIRMPVRLMFSTNFIVPPDRFPPAVTRHSKRQVDSFVRALLQALQQLAIPACNLAR